MTNRDKLVDRACRRDEVVDVRCHDSHSLEHPERPAREESYSDKNLGYAERPDAVKSS